MVCIGNAYHLNELDLSKLDGAITLGCNRILWLMEPTYLTVVDRDPYRQHVDLIKRTKSVPLLSSTLYDPGISCNRVPVQPLPAFPWVSFTAITAVDPKEGTAVAPKSQIRYPILSKDPLQPLVSGANIAYIMLQLAYIMGANPIAFIGVDMEWKDEDRSHFFGKGANVGAFRFNTQYTMSFFNEAARWLKEKEPEREVYNLSPVKGAFDCFPRMGYDEFFHRFSVDDPLRGDPVRVREFLQFGGAGLNPLARPHYDWGQPTPTPPTSPEPEPEPESPVPNVPPSNGCASSGAGIRPYIELRGPDGCLPGG